MQGTIDAEAFKEQLTSLQKDYPASAFVNFFYLKLLHDKWGMEYDKKKSKWLLSIPNRHFFHQTQIEYPDFKQVITTNSESEFTPTIPKKEEAISTNVPETVLQPEPKIENSVTEDSANDTISNEEIGGLVEKFCHNAPKIFFNADIHDPNANFGEASCKEDPEIISETLAIIYADQGYTGKAEKIFKKLSLQFPEKSCYFADQIKKIKNREFNQ